VEKALRDHPDIILKLHAHEIKIAKGELLSLIGRLPHTDPDHPHLVDIANVRDAIMAMEGVAKASAVQDLKHKIMTLGHDMRELHNLLKGSKSRRGARFGMSEEQQHEPSRSVASDGTPTPHSTRSEASVRSANTTEGRNSPELSIHRRVIALSTQMQRLEGNMIENQHKVDDKLEQLVLLLQNQKEEARQK